MTKKIVIDACIVTKWFVKDHLEADVDLADGLLVAMLVGDIEIHAPRILTYEVSGVLSRVCRTRYQGTKKTRLGKKEAIKSIRDLFDLPLQISEPTKNEAVTAGEMAINYSKEFEDMTYLRLAEELDCQLYTADEKMVKGCPPGYPKNRILLLSSLR